MQATRSLHDELTGIVRGLLNGERNPVDDANLVEADRPTDSESRFWSTHGASNQPGSVLVKYTLYTIWEKTENGSVEIDPDSLDDLPYLTDATERAIENLRSGDRHPIDDAISIEELDGLQAVEVVHETVDGGLTFHYNYDTAYIFGSDANGEEYDLFHATDCPLCRVGLGE